MNELFERKVMMSIITRQRIASGFPFAIASQNLKIKTENVSTGNGCPRLKPW